MISGLKKCHFSTILAGNSIVSRMGCFAVLHANQLKTEVFCPVVCEQPVQFTVYKRAAALIVHVNSAKNPIRIIYLRVQTAYPNLP